MQLTTIGLDIALRAHLAELGILAAQGCEGLKQSEVPSTGTDSGAGHHQEQHLPTHSSANSHLIGVSTTG